MFARCWMKLAVLGLGIFLANAFVPSQVSRGGSLCDFAGRQPKCHDRRRMRDSTFSRRELTRFKVIERLSSECIEAVKVAQDIGSGIGLGVITPEVLFAGTVAKPENAASTLDDYGISAEEVEKSAVLAVKVDASVSKKASGMSGVEALPFSSDSKAALNRACTIAETFGSSETGSEHLLLSLLGYNDGKKIERSPAIQALNKMESFTRQPRERKFSVYSFCEDLVENLQNGRTTKKEVVVIGGKIGSTNTLDEVGVDMTQMALDGQLDPVFGRNKEIRTALRTLGRRRKNNPCLIGDPGVGKTSVAEAVAQVLAGPIAEAQQNSALVLPKIRLRNPFRRNSEVEKETETEIVQEVAYELPPCPKSLVGYRLVSIDLAGLVAGTSNRGDFEKRVKNLVTEARNNKVILFIDEIHNLIGTGGGGDGAMNAANILKPALAKGDIRLLGATTTSEYRRYIERDGALERRFQPQQVKEPSVDDTLDILAAVMPKYEEYHGVKYTSNAILAAAKLSDRYINERFLPDKAIDLLDEAGSMTKMTESGDSEFVTEDTVASVVSEITGIPVGKLDLGEKERLQRLEDDMKQTIKGQDRAVQAVAKSIRRARSGLRDMQRPIASFFFAGPTGVGKTELCKALAQTYYGQKKNMIRIDMSEYMDRFSTSRLLGAPPGYVGYDEGGQLTEAVRRTPHAVVLFDELEKAHEDVLNLLLQILDEGCLTDGKGRTVSFRNTVIVMTSNIGSTKVLDIARNGDDRKGGATSTAEVVKEELEKAMKPELINRIDDIVVFSPLSLDNLRDIASNLCAETRSRVSGEQNVELSVSDNVVDFVAREAMATSAIYGARPVRRSLQRVLEDPLAEAFVNGFFDEGDNLRVAMQAMEKLSPALKITKTCSLTGSVEEKVVPVDMDGTDNVASDRWRAVYEDLPSLDDSPPRETDTFQ